MGAFGALRGSIGSVTYSTLNTNRAGQRVQVARQKATQVSNPNSVAQILQRMKLTPAQRFYDAFEKVVAKGIMSHSWEGVSYGNPSRQEFMSRAMKNDAAVYVPKGYNKFAPGEYEVSAGSLPTFPWRVDLGNTQGGDPMENPLIQTNEPLTSAQVDGLLSFGLQLGDQISVIGAVESSTIPGTYEPFAYRTIVGKDSQWETSGPIFQISFNGVGVSVNQSNVAAVAVIISRGQNSGDAKRSNSQMLLLGDYKNLISNDALNAAIASYEEGGEISSLGSDWYLNNTPLAGQAVAGEVKLIEVTAKRENGEPTSITRNFLVVERTLNGQIGFYVVVEGNNADGNALAPSTEVANFLAVVPWDASDTPALVDGMQVSRGLIESGANVFGYIGATAAIAAQAGYSYEV